MHRLRTTSNGRFTTRLLAGRLLGSRGLHEQLHTLEERCATQELGIDTALFLASRMVEHPNKSVRAYVSSIERLFAAETQRGGAIALGPGGSPVAESNVIATFVRRWGEDLDSREPSDPSAHPSKASATNARDLEVERSWMCTDWLVRTHTAAWLTLANLPDLARTLLHLPAVNTHDELERSGAILRAVAGRVEQECDRRRVAAGADSGEAEHGEATVAHLVRSAKATWVTGAAGAAVEVGAEWSPYASRITETAVWAWAWGVAAHNDEAAVETALEDLGLHVHRLQRTALELLDHMILHSEDWKNKSEIV